MEASSSNFHFELLTEDPFDVAFIRSSPLAHVTRHRNGLGKVAL